MKKTQREPVVKIDEFEDLTLFANESFDTLDVDLFEFSREESSP
jgi:pilus assembly protein FimV